MGDLTKQIRQAADCAPLWRSIFEAAADEIERLQEDNNKIRGRMHDQWINQNKAKAEAVREAITYSAKTDNHQKTSYEAYEIMTDYANKLERG